MAVWTLMPANKKSIEEVVYWEKDGKTIFFRQGWRSVGSTTYCPSCADKKRKNGRL